MAYILVGSTDTMQLQLPSKGTTNWEQTLRLGTFQPLAVHDHVHSGGKGNGRGAPITNLAILLQNGGYLLGRNAADSANVDILKINSSNKVEIEPHVCQEVNSTLTVAIGTSHAAVIADTAITSASQCAIIKYSLKRTGITSILMGEIYLDQGNIKVTENSADTAILNDSVTTPFLPYLSDPADPAVNTEIKFTENTNQLHVQNSGSNTYTLYLHITRLG